MASSHIRGDIKAVKLILEPFESQMHERYVALYAVGRMVDGSYVKLSTGIVKATDPVDEACCDIGRVVLRAAKLLEGTSARTYLSVSEALRY